MPSTVLYVLLGLLGLLGHGLSAAIEHVRLRHDNYHCFDEKPKLENGYYEVLRNDGHVIRAYCNQGFSLVGDTLRICDNATKRFSGGGPVCQDIDECLEIGDVNGSDEGSAGGATYLDDEDDSPVPCHRLAKCINTPGSYRCQCDPGYHGDGYRCSEIPTLHVNINTNTSLKVECQSPDPPEHGFVYQRDAEIVRFYCHPDYSIHGNSVIKCTNGTWSARVPRCIPGWNTCGDPGIPENGFRIGNRFSSGNVVRYKCRQAYKLVGPRFRICTAMASDKLEWTSVLPNCTRPPPAKPDHDFDDEEDGEDEEDEVIDENEVIVDENTISRSTDVVIPTTTTTKTNTSAPTTTQTTTTATSPPTTTSTIESQSTANITSPPNTTVAPSTEEAPDIGIEIVEQVDDPVRSGLLQQNCGVPTKLDDQLSWPWLVEIQFRGVGGSSSDEPLCHGVLVCSDWVLTAASCLQTSEEHHARLLEPYDILVSFGEKDWSVHNIVRHPGYFMNAHGDNLALIMMKMSREEKQQQMPVCLIRSTALGVRSNAVAWDYSANTTSPVRFLLDDKCTKSTTVSEDFICTDTKSPLGAPLLVDSSSSSSLLSLFGLATSLDSAIYTTVIRQVKWIVQMTEACEL